ncbi:MAG: carboxypeptidase regulatory-like domain-containing protein, partial [Acidobacteria bacterium]
MSRSHLVILASLLAATAMAQQPLPGQGARGQARPGAAQPATRDSRTAPSTGTGSISGHVSTPEGKPLRKAVVRLNVMTNQGRSQAAVTDAEGGYEFRDLPAGRYTLFASKSGYVRAAAAAMGERVDLKDGLRAEKVDLTLSRGCAITGRVFDEYGEPASDVFVSAVRERSIAGRRQLAPAGGSRSTDDLGQYR